MRMNQLLMLCVATVPSILGGCAAGPDKSAYDMLIGAADKASALTGYENGKMFLDSGDYVKAIEAFNADISNNVSPVRALNGKAVAYDRLGRPDLAQVYLNQAYGIKPDSPVTLNNMAYLRLEQGDPAGALALAERARTLLQTAQVGPEVGQTLHNNEVLIRSAMADIKTNKEAEAPVMAAAQAPAQLARVSEREWGLDVMVNSPAKSALKSGVAAPKLALTSPAPVPAAAAKTPTALAEAVDNTPMEAPAVAPAKTPVAKVANAKPVSSSRTADVETRDVPPVQAGNMPVRLRITNASGRNSMAHHFKRYFTAKGVPVGSLTNAQKYGRDHSTIFYRSDLKDEADALAKKLPVAVNLFPMDKAPGKIELMMGTDLDAFDVRLAAGEMPSVNKLAQR
jgi:Tfp pilus assembly protein PilF